MLFPTTKSISSKELEAWLHGKALVYPITSVRKTGMMEEQKEVCEREERGKGEGERRGEHTVAHHSTNLGCAGLAQTKLLSV